MKADLAASLGASLVAGLLQVVLVPVYVAMMGVESYGIVGFQMAMMGLLQLLDLGLATTLNRIMSTGGPERAAAARTLEAIYLTIAAVIGIGAWSAASLIANHWLSPGAMPATQVEAALKLMAGAFFGQWMSGFYMAGLNGLERFRWSAAIKGGAACIGHGGNLLVLVESGGDITAFMAWQCLFTVAVALVSRCSFTALLPPGSGSGWSGLRQHWSFAGGVGVIGLTGVLIMNLDKAVLSHLLTLREFGYFSMAVTVAGGMYLIITPLYNLTFPRLSALVRAGDEQAVGQCYHLRSQLMAWLVLPVAATVICGAHPLIFAWTGRMDHADATAPLVALVVLGTTANALMNVPFALQLAYGRTQLGLKLNLLMLAVQIPSLLVLVPALGALGGAATWALCNGVYLLVGLPATHRQFLHGGQWRWLSSTVGPLVLTAALAPALFWLLPLPMPTSRWLAAAELALVGAIALTASAFAARLLFPAGPLAALAKVIRFRR